MVVLILRKISSWLQRQWRINILLPWAQKFYTPLVLWRGGGSKCLWQVLPAAKAKSLKKSFRVKIKKFRILVQNSEQLILPVSTLSWLYWARDEIGARPRLLTPKKAKERNLQQHWLSVRRKVYYNPQTKQPEWGGYDWNQNKLQSFKRSCKLFLHRWWRPVRA